MAYSNAIFYIDYVNGSDAARATLSNVVFSNPSGDLVMGTYNSHGLITGACITVSACTQAYANTAWKITKIDDDTFYLDDASWASFTGADVTGNVVPFGGMSWADAWATINNGASAARIAPGDVIRIAKTPDPAAIGKNATWTTTTIDGGGDKASKSIVSSTDATPIVMRATGHGLTTGDIVVITAHTVNYNANGAWVVTRVDDNYFSLDGSVATGGGAGGATGTITPSNTKAVVLASAVTKKIDDCEGGWAASGSSTVTNTTTGKMCYGMKVAKSSPSNNTLYAYKTITEGDYSAYTGITLWIYITTAIDATTRWKICLCSDTAGATVVDEFLIPITGTYTWIALNLAKVGGGNLGASIKSVALYSGAAGATTAGITLDNINACTAGGFSVGDLISKNSLAVGGTEGFYALDGIYDKILLMSGYRGYYGTTETVALYYRKTQLVTATGTITDSGTEGNLIQFLGGWNTATTTQDGETYLDGFNGNVDIIDSNGKIYIKFDRISCIRGSYGMELSAATGYIEIGSINDIYDCSTGVIAQANIVLDATAFRRINGCPTGMTLDAENFQIDSIGQITGGQQGLQLYTGAGKTQGLITSIGDICNHSQYGIHGTVTNPGVVIGTINHLSYDGMGGLYLNATRGVIIEKISEANHNVPYGVYFYNQCANNEIGEITDCSYNTAYGVLNHASAGCNYIGEIVTSNNATGGIRNEGQELYIGKATCGEVSKLSLGTSNLSLIGVSEWEGTPNRWYRIVTNGVISDQITGGQDAAWAFGGEGLCQYYNPTSSSVPLYDECFIPCTAAQGIQVHFQVKKTSAAANCTMKVSVSGCGVTPLRRGAVSLTDSWAEYTSGTFTPAETGFLKVVFEIQDGSTTGDIGIDQIHYLEV